MQLDRLLADEAHRRGRAAPWPRDTAAGAPAASSSDLQRREAGHRAGLLELHLHVGHAVPQRLEAAIGTPNCLRVFMYSTVTATSAVHAPDRLGAQRGDAAVDRALEQRVAPASSADQRSALRCTFVELHLGGARAVLRRIAAPVTPGARPGSRRTGRCRPVVVGAAGARRDDEGGRLTAPAGTTDLRPFSTHCRRRRARLVSHAGPAGSARGAPVRERQASLPSAMRGSRACAALGAACAIGSSPTTTCDDTAPAPAPAERLHHDHRVDRAPPKPSCSRDRQAEQRRSTRAPPRPVGLMPSRALTISRRARSRSSSRRNLLERVLQQLLLFGVVEVHAYLSKPPPKGKGVAHLLELAPSHRVGAAFPARR